MSLSLDCRYASLLAFLESRDSQTRLSFDDRPSQDDGCGRQDGGRFGQGNNCAGGGSGGRGPYARLPDSLRLTPNGSSAKYDEKQLKHGSPFASAAKLKSLKVTDPPKVLEIAKKSGLKDPSDILTIAAATAKGTEATISASDLTASVRVKALTPIDPNNPDLGMASVQVAFGRDKDVHYDYFSPNSYAFQSIANGQLPLSVVSASVLSLMSQSLEAAEKSGMKSASTYAAGVGTGTFASGPDGGLQGYRLWPKFGFDGDVDSATSKSFANLLNASTLLSDEAKERYVRTRTFRVQDIIATKEGEDWWNAHGGALDLTLDFTDKNSPGYKRYKETVEVGKKAAKRLARQGRSANEFWEWVSQRSGTPSLAEFAEARNCGTGSGGFQKGNTCSSGAAADVASGAAKGAVSGAAYGAGRTIGFPPAVAAGAAVGAVAGAVKGLYDNKMRPTRAGKAIAKVGSSDEKIASMVKSLGGSPKSIADADGKSGLKIAVKDGDGKKLFDVKMTDREIVISPSKGSLSSKQIEKIKEVATENHPHATRVVVDSMPTSTLVKVAKAGGSIAYDASLGFVAGFVLPSLPSVAGTAAEMVAGQTAGKVVGSAVGVVTEPASILSGVASESVGDALRKVKR